MGVELLIEEWENHQELLSCDNTEEVILLPFFNQLNKNERIYNYDSIDLSEYQDLIKNHSALGELNPSTENIDLSKVSHKIVSIRKTKKGITGIIELLETPYGKIAKSLLESGIEMSMSARFVGTVDLNNIAHVDQIISFDLAFDKND